MYQMYFHTTRCADYKYNNFPYHLVYHLRVVLLPLHNGGKHCFYQDTCFDVITQQV